MTAIWITPNAAYGLFADIPPADGTNLGYEYFATDVNGGTLYRNIATVWTQIAAGVSAVGAVSSVFTRTGAVTAQTGDYTAAQVGALAASATLHGIAAANANDGDIAVNSHKITGLTNGSASSDAAAFGQIPAALPPNGSAGGDLTGTYPNPTLGGIGSAIGPIGSTSAIPVVTIDTKGRVTALTSASPTLSSVGAPTADVPWNAKKITGLANGSASTDAAAFGQIPTSLPFRSGGTFFYSPNFGATANSAFTQSTLFAMPFYVPVATTFTKITAVCVTGAAASTVRLGIYSDTSGKPDALVLDATTVATTSSSINASITISQLLNPGWYWLACASQGGAPTLQGCSGNNVNQLGNVPTTNPFSNGPMHGYSQTGVTGALPSPWGATATQQQTLPIVWLTPQ